MLELTAREIHDTVYKRYISSRNIQKPPRPLLFLGSSGVGKTVSIRAAAQSVANKTGQHYIDYADFSRLSESEKNDLLQSLESKGERPFFFVDLLLLSHEPSDFSGIPRESEVMDSRVTKFIPMEWATLLSKYPGIVFLDELTNVNRDDIRGVAYKIVDERRTGSILLSPEVQIIAAGNRPDDSSVALPLPAPLLNRMAVFYATAPTAEDWYKYASSKWQEADSFLLGYLAKIAASPETPDGQETLRQYATPRACEIVLEEEMAHRIGLQEEVSSDDMGKIALPALGNKEGELLSGWWSRREEIIRFLSNGRGADTDTQISPAALWAVGTYVGRVANMMYDSKGKTSLVGMDSTIESNMGEIVKNITKHGKEYAVPIYLGMNAFTKGSDPFQSACKAAYIVDKMNSKDDFLSRNKKENTALVSTMANFNTSTPGEYFNGTFSRNFCALASDPKNESIGRFVSVGERLLADQAAEVMKELGRIKEIKQPIVDAVGESFAKRIVGFDATADWQKVLAESQWQSDTSESANKAAKKSKSTTKMLEQNAKQQGQSQSIS